jgi:hypothetical protein
MLQLTSWLSLLYLPSSSSHSFCILLSCWKSPSTIVLFLSCGRLWPYSGFLTVIMIQTFLLVLSPPLVHLQLPPLLACLLIHFLQIAHSMVSPCTLSKSLSHEVCVQLDCLDNNCLSSFWISILDSSDQCSRVRELVTLSTVSLCNPGAVICNASNIVLHSAL